LCLSLKIEHYSAVSPLYLWLLAPLVRPPALASHSVLDVRESSLLLSEFESTPFSISQTPDSRGGITMMYYVARDGQQYGPYSADTVRQYLAAGSLEIADMAREESGQSWVPLGQFFPPAMAVPQPPPFQPQPQTQSQAQPQYTSGPPYNTPPYGAQVFNGQPGMQPGIPQVLQQIMPPDLHWALVLLFTLFTSGIFTLVWALIQANYAKKIDASSKAVLFYVLWVVGSIINFVLYISLIMMIINTGRADEAVGGLGGIIFLVWIASCIFFVAGTYSVRASMIEYYNTREPIQLQLSGVMTFFFSIYYLQHHMSRIAAWKKSGYLSV